ncbi:hypothetical protein AAHE18_14G170800 [Arachis hypogaea]
MLILLIIILLNAFKFNYKKPNCLGISIDMRDYSTFNSIYKCTICHKS